VQVIFPPLSAAVLGIHQATRQLVERSLEGLSPPTYRVYGSPVTAVVCTHNEEGYIERCLTCLKNQTHQPIELVVVDYRSRDRTREIARSFGARVVEASEPGVGNARDLGADAASYEPLFFTDADCIFENRLIEEMLKDLSSYGAVTVAPVYYDTDSPILLAGICISRFAADWLVSGRGTLIRRETLSRVGGWELPYWEERHLSEKLRVAGIPVRRRRDLAVATSARRWRGESRALRILRRLKSF